MQISDEKVFQQDIVNRLVSHGWTLGTADQAIGLMKERRTALIAAAVTGKIDVRGEAGLARTNVAGLARTEGAGR